MITLRKAVENDTKDLFDWRNDQDTRNASIDDRPINYQDHEKWMKNVINDRNRLLYIAEEKGAKIGMVRFDIEGEIAEVSINLAPNMRGKGYGARLLDMAHQKLNAEKKNLVVSAKVKASNMASIKTFLKAGYKKTTEKEDKRDQGILFFERKL